MRAPEIVLVDPHAKVQASVAGQVRPKGRITEAIVSVVLQAATRDGATYRSVEVKKPVYEGAPRNQPVDFELTAPAFPPSYEGELLSLRYVVQAEVWADGGLAGEPVRGEASLSLELPERPGLRLSMLRPGDPDGVDGRDGSSVAVATVLGGGTAALTLYAAVIAQPVLAAIGGLLTGVLGIGAGAAARRARVERKVGQPQVQIAPKTGAGYREKAGATDAFEATVWLRSGAPVERLTVGVIVREEVDVERDGGTITEVHDVWSGHRDLSPDEPGVYRGELPLPEPGATPYAWQGSRARILWWLGVTVWLTNGEVVEAGPFRLVAEPRLSPGPRRPGDPADGAHSASR